MPGLLAQALPKDIRDFLLLSMPHKKAWEFAPEGVFRRKSDFEYPQFLSMRVSTLMGEQKRIFEAGLPAVLRTGTKIPFRSLTAVQQSALLSILFFREINRFSFSLMHDDLAPFQKDVMQASLHLHPNDNVLEIGTMTHEGGMETYRFFGAPIAPPPTIGQNQADKKP